MSCNGCRVLRKGCSESCVLRPCLQWIHGAEAQGHATIFVAKFFGRAGLMSFISAVPEPQRPALFQSLLFEACGRTISPVHGAAGLLWSGNWHLSQAAVDTVLRGGALRQIPELDSASCTGGGAEDDDDDGKLLASPKGKTGGWTSFSVVKRRSAAAEEGPAPCDLDLWLSPPSPVAGREEKMRRRPGTPSMNSEESGTTSGHRAGGAGAQPRLLNLFV